MNPAELLESLLAPEPARSFLEIPAFGVLLSGAPAYGPSGNIAVGAFLVDGDAVRSKLALLSEALPFSTGRDLLTQILAPVRARSVCDGWSRIACGYPPDSDPDGRVGLFFSEVTAGPGAAPFAWAAYTPHDSEAYDDPTGPAEAWRRILEASGLRCGAWPAASARRFAAGHAILPEVVADASAQALAFSEEPAIFAACAPAQPRRPSKL